VLPLDQLHVLYAVRRRPDEPTYIQLKIVHNALCTWSQPTAPADCADMAP
jgi:hypothetical protein